jgi:hypothetical protein
MAKSDSELGQLADILLLRGKLLKGAVKKANDAKEKVTQQELLYETAFTNYVRAQGKGFDYLY